MCSGEGRADARLYEASCVTSAKLCNLSVPQCPDLENRSHSIYLRVVASRTTLQLENSLEQCPTQSSCYARVC